MHTIRPVTLTCVTRRFFWQADNFFQVVPYCYRDQNDRYAATQRISLSAHKDVLSPDKAPDFPTDASMVLDKAVNDPGAFSGCGRGHLQSTPVNRRQRLHMAQGFERLGSNHQMWSGPGNGTGPAGELSVFEQETGVFHLKPFAALLTPSCFQGIALIKNQSGSEKKRQYSRQAFCLFQKLQYLEKKKMGGRRPFMADAEGLQKSGAVGGHAQTGNIPAQAGQSPDQHSFLQGQIRAMP